MGAIWTSRIALITTTSEIVGYKSGLALNREELRQHAPEDYQSLWLGDDQDVIRIRSEEFEEIFVSILERVGNAPASFNLMPCMALRLRYKDDPAALPIIEGIMKLLPALTEAIAASRGKGTIDPTRFIKDSYGQFGSKGGEIAVAFCECLNGALHSSPWGPYRQVKWADVADLRELFVSESLQTLYGSFFDQRYIDYLHRNFNRIDDVNWRKFEALTCEFFERIGFYVQIGEGRDDGGIDARVWPTGSDTNRPPTILIQCKRRKTRVPKVVVKALYADILHENAASGLIVTTSSLEPGAAADCTARAYPIEEANRHTLAQWIEAMRTPHTGIVMGE